MKQYNNFPTIAINILFARYLKSTRWNGRTLFSSAWFLFYNPTGTAEIVTCGEKISIDNQHAYLLPPHCNFNPISKDYFSHLYAYFDLSGQLDRITRKLYALPPEPAMEMFDLVKTSKSKWKLGLGWNRMILSYLEMLPDKAFTPPAASSLVDVRIQNILDMCKIQQPNKFTNAELADMAGMSLNNFYRLFKSVTGMSPKYYRLNIQLERARKLLNEKESDIEKIATTCGFADRYQFSKAFKKHYGIPPGKYREQLNEFILKPK